jgi:hypothetical protein
MRPRLLHLLAITAFAAVFLVSSTAAAINGYKSRQQLFVGVGVGGGPATAYVGEGLTTGLDGRAVGLHAHGAIGGGINDRVVLSGELNHWFHSARVNQDTLRHHHSALMANADVFLVHGIYAGGALGLAYGVSQAADRGVEIQRYQEMGVAVRGNAGVEYFLNGTIAAGFRLSYTRHLYQNVDFDTFLGAITVRWY